MTAPVVNTVFVPGTTITHEWLNGVNDYVNESNPADHLASNVTCTPTGSITATNVQDAIEQLNTYNEGSTGAVDRTIPAKLSDFVSVKDFGAVGDYNNDDTTAIQAALDSGANIYFPPGNYIVTSSLTIPTSFSRQIYHGAGRDNTVFYYRPPANQADMFVITSGDNIEFRDMSFVLQNWGSRTLICAFAPDYNVNSMRWFHCDFSYWNRAAIKHDSGMYDIIEDCRFLNCTDTTNTMIAKAIWYSTFANSVTIRNCRFSGNDQSILLSGGSATRVEDCSFEGNGDTANTVPITDTNFFNNMSGFRFVGNYVEAEKPGANYAAVAFQGCHGVSVFGNTFSGDYGGVDITDTFIRFAEGTYGVTVENNHFNNPKNYISRQYLSPHVVKFHRNWYTDGFTATPVTTYNGIMALFSSPEYIDLDVSYTFTWNPASLADGAGETSATQGITGLQYGDHVLASAGVSTAGMLVCGYVSGVSEAKVRIQNETGSTVDLASSTWTINISKAYN